MKIYFCLLQLVYACCFLLLSSIRKEEEICVIPGFVQYLQHLFKDKGEKKPQTFLIAVKGGLLLIF